MKSVNLSYSEIMPRQYSVSSWDNWWAMMGSLGLRRGVIHLSLSRHINAFLIPVPLWPEYIISHLCIPPQRANNAELGCFPCCELKELLNKQYSFQDWNVNDARVKLKWYKKKWPNELQWIKRLPFYFTKVGQITIIYRATEYDIPSIL